jgi:formylglycine-generating enzyme required for sulfatase activity
MHSRHVALRALLLVGLLLLSCDSTSPSAAGDSFAPSGMRLLRAAGQSFVMGSDLDGDPQHQPEFTVSFTYDFWIDTTEVTQGEYQGLLHTNPSAHIAELLPAENVTWYDAALYCNARSIRDGLDTVYAYDSVSGAPGAGSELHGCRLDLDRTGYRLPTEAEWEYACRGETTTRAWWGTWEDTAMCRANAWFSLNSSGAPQVVATKPANPFGLYDMAGNVREWCNDRYGAYDSLPRTDPEGPDTGEARVVRNIDYGIPVFSNANYLRSAYRNRESPALTRNGYGFRCVLR